VSSPAWWNQPNEDAQLPREEMPRLPGAHGAAEYIARRRAKKREADERAADRRLSEWKDGGKVGRP